MQQVFDAGLRLAWGLFAVQKPVVARAALADLAEADLQPA